MEPIAGRYHPTHLLARAGSVEVHAAQDDRLGRPVALALLPPGAGSPADAAQFESTGRVLARLSHPGVAATLDRGRHGGASFVAFERPPSEVASGLARGPWDAGRAARLAADLVAGVDALHRAGACHGSIHPGSVGLAPDGSALLTPWPVADPPPGWGGPQGWLAPERVAGDAPSVRADLWAAAAVVLAALVGPGPRALDDSELAALTGTLWNNADPTLLAALAVAMRRDPAERYASASEMASALETLHPQPAGALVATFWPAPGTGRAPEAARPLPAPRLWRWGWRGAAVGLVALCLPLAVLEAGGAPPAPASCVQPAAGVPCSLAQPAGHPSAGPRVSASAAGQPAPVVALPAAPATPSVPPAGAASAAVPAPTPASGGGQPTVAQPAAAPSPAAAAPGSGTASPPTAGSAGAGAPGLAAHHPGAAGHRAGDLQGNEGLGQSGGRAADR